MKYILTRRCTWFDNSPGISQTALAKAIAVPPRRIHEIIAGKRAISADTALRLAAFFQTDAQSWLNLQSHYDAEQTREKLAGTLAHIPAYDTLALSENI